MNNFFRKLTVILGCLLIMSSFIGCSSTTKKENAEIKIEDNLSEYKNGDRVYKSEVVPTTDIEKTIAESLKISISDNFDKIRELFVERGANFDDDIQIAKKHLEEGEYTERITIHSFSKVSEEVYTNKESEIKYYPYLDELKKYNPYEVEVIEVKYTNKLTEKYDKGAQWGSGTYTRYYVMTKENKDAKFKIFDIYGHM